jgi:hypothetical protein
MGDVARTLLGTLALIVVVLGGLGLFLTTMADVISHEGHMTRRIKVEAIGVTVFLVLLIAGSFFWLRFISVGVG